MASHPLNQLHATAAAFRKGTVEGGAVAGSSEAAEPDKARPASGVSRPGTGEVSPRPVSPYRRLKIQGGHTMKKVRIVILGFGTW